LDLLREYASRIAQLSFSQVTADPSLMRNDAWHLDFITWAAQAFIGAGLDHLMVIPPAQILDVPAWYAEPVFSKSERFWVLLTFLWAA